MTNRLVIHFPCSTITLDVDDLNKLSTISSFCKEKLEAYHASEDIYELTVDELNETMSDQFHSLLFELGLF